jgi:hypothetical protein
MRRILIAIVATVVVASVAVLPVAAAPQPNEHARPQVIDFDLIEPEAAAFFTAACGFPVTVDAEGWVKIIPLTTAGNGRRQPLELNIYHLSSETLSSEWGSFQTPLDVGPDVIYLEDGVVKVALTGRSTTGSGVIGRVVINTDTGEVESEAGNVVFEDFVATVCAALAPPA